MSSTATTTATTSATLLPPTDIVAVESDKRSYLFYVSADARLCYLLGPAGGKEDYAAADYKQEKLVVDGKEVEVWKDCKQVAAVSYATKDKDGKDVAEIRVYYADKSGNLKEACRTEGQRDGKWYGGSLGWSEKWPVAKQSSISASVQYSSSQLKVYYAKNGNTDDDTGMQQMSVIWVTLGEKVWASRGVTRSITGY